MELVLHMSINLTREQLVTNSLYSRPLSLSNYYSKTLFTCFTRNSLRDCKLHFLQTRIALNSTRTFVLSGGKQKLWVCEEEEEGEEEFEDDEEAEGSSYSDDESSLLSLSVKPNRNMALLDDYEIEEFDYASNVNHRSGLFILLVAYSWFGIMRFLMVVYLIALVSIIESEEFGINF